MSRIVLVVDDDPDTSRIISTVLLARGYEVRLAGDGRAALDSIRDKRPDLVLLDIMMPGLDGIRVLDGIRADPGTTSLPVILVTAKSSDPDILEGYRLGAQYYVTKPFALRELLYAVSLVLGANVPRSA